MRSIFSRRFISKMICRCRAAPRQVWRIWRRGYLGRGAEVRCRLRLGDCATRQTLATATPCALLPVEASRGFPGIRPERNGYRSGVSDAVGSFGTSFRDTCGRTASVFCRMGRSGRILEPGDCDWPALLLYQGAFLSCGSEGRGLCEVTLRQAAYRSPNRTPGPRLGAHPY
jgi:hypothetical protein